MRDLELNKAWFRVQEVHSTVGKTAPDRGAWGEYPSHIQGSPSSLLDSSLEEALLGCGEGSGWGGLTRALCASEACSWPTA